MELIQNNVVQLTDLAQRGREKDLFILGQAIWDGQPLLERLYQIVFVECFRK